MARKRMRSEPATTDLRSLDSLPPILTPRMVSRLVFGGGITEKTLSKRRLEGGGPVFRRRGHPTRGRVLYLREDVITWMRNLPAATTTTEERIRVESCAGAA